MRFKFSPTRILLLFFYGSLAMGQLGRLSLPQMPSVYLHEIALLLLNLTALLNPKSRIAYVKVIRGAKFWWLFIGTLVISLGVNLSHLGSNLLPSGLYLLRLCLYASLVPFIISFKSIQGLQKYLPLAVPVTALVLALLGIGQYLFIPDTRLLYWLGWDLHLYRSIGTLFDPNFLGIITVIAVFLTPVITKKWRWGYFSILAVCLLLTYSRSSYLALIAGGIILTLKKGYFKAFLGAMVIFLAILLVLPNRGGEGNRLDRIYSLQNRFDSQKTALLIYQNHPIFGVGFNAYNLYRPSSSAYDFIPKRTSSPDNSFLLVLATAGLFGFTALLLLLKHHLQTLVGKPYLLAVWTAVLVHALFNNTLFYPHVMAFLASITAASGFKENTLL